MNKSFIFTDVHGCGKELETLIQPFIGYDMYSLGDNFDGAFDGVKVWEIIHKYDVKCIMGNHEKKMLRFLKGEISWVPKHYYYFLREFDKKYKLKDLVQFLEKLPTIRTIDSYVLVHAGINVHAPTIAHESFNVYGRERHTIGDWWKTYEGNHTVIYGHISHTEPYIRTNQAGIVNSICIDTSACRGNKLTGILLENTHKWSLHSVDSPDYYSDMNRLAISRFPPK